MGLQLKTLFSFLIILSVFLSSCLKDQDIEGLFLSKISVDQRFNQSIAWNKNHPSREIIVQSDDYLILSMSDSHVGGTNNLDSFLTIARTRNANAVLLAGDLTTGHTKDYEVFQKHLTDTDSMPTFLSVGNHDLHFSGWEDYYARFGSSSYLFTIKTPVATDLFICLDTGGGTLGDKQMDWLVNILQTMRSKYRRCTVFTHNNFFRFRHAESTNPPVEELAVLIEIFTKYKVDMVITGHDHKQDAVLFGLTTYIVMDPLEDTESNAGYLQLTVKNGKTEFRFERL